MGDATPPGLLEAIAPPREWEVEARGNDPVDREPALKRARVPRRHWPPVHVRRPIEAAVAVPYALWLRGLHRLTGRLLAALATSIRLCYNPRGRIPSPIRRRLEARPERAEGW